MIPKKIQNILKAHNWEEEESQASIYIMDHWATCHLETYPVYKRKLFSVSIYALKEDYGYEWTSGEEAKSILEWVLDTVRKNKSYFNKKEKELLLLNKKIDAIFRKIRDKGLEKYRKKDLIKEWLDLYEVGKRQYGYAIISECLDILEEKDYLKYLKNVPANKLHDIVGLLSTPSNHFMDKEHLSLSHLAKYALKNKALVNAIKNNSLINIKKHEKFYQELQTHIDNYFWIQNNFSKSINLNETYFLKELKDILIKNKSNEILSKIHQTQNKEEYLKKKRMQIYKKYNLSPDSILFFGIVRQFAFWQDMRKENVQKMVFCVARIIKEVSMRYKEQFLNLKKYKVKDVVELIENGKKVPKEDLNKRKNVVFIATFDNGKIRKDYFYGKQAKEIYDYMTDYKRNLSEEKILKGFVASKGERGNVIKGKVRIVFDPVKDVFKTSEILVTGMTRPEYVPLMKKAKAIITNEGGITSHAAIISRELKVPCIIGTKVATKILKNGDLVEVDANKGIVRRLK